MASVTRTSGGRIPVDSTVTGREKKHQNHNLQSAKVKEMDVKAAKSNLTKPKGYNA